MLHPIFGIGPVGRASAFMETVLDDTTAAAALTTLGIGTGDSPTFTGLTLSNNYTNSGQPAFLVNNSTTDSNVTGNGAVATVDFDTEIFDQGADFATDTFTAPVAGRYLLQAQVDVNGQTSAADQLNIRLVTSNRTYINFYIFTNSLPSTMARKITAVADMDASDTVTVTIEGIGEASDLMDVIGGASPRTWFSGCLLA